jgi:hypothetical protein
MTDNTAAPSPAPAETSAAPSTDLESIAREFSVEEQANQFTARPAVQHQPQQQLQPAPFSAPDPVTDPEGYKAFVMHQTQVHQRLEGTLRELDNRFKTYEQTIQQQKVDADVDAAVKIVNQKLKVDPELAEIALERMYRKDKAFKQIWDNRDRNRQAFEKALGVVADKLQPTFAVRTDPQVAENVRAAKSSQQTMATTQAKSEYDDVPENPREFDAWWRQRRGN